MIEEPRTGKMFSLGGAVMLTAFLVSGVMFAMSPAQAHPEHEGSTHEKAAHEKKVIIHKDGSTAVHHMQHGEVIASAMGKRPRK